MRIDDFNISRGLRDEITCAVSKRRLPHAIIVSSGTEQQRLDFALFLAAASVCSSHGEVPCLLCKNCKKAFDGNHPDILYFEREKGKKEFSVKIVRDMIKPQAYVKPNEADSKVFIIKDAQFMNSGAQNALLKIFEEPPAGVRFILCCDYPSALLETIRSRAAEYPLIAGENQSEESDEAAKIAQSLALSLLSAYEYDFLSQTGVFEKNKELLMLTFQKMQIIFRDAVAIKNNAPLMGTAGETAQKIASALSVQRLTALISELDGLNNSLNRNANMNLLITRFCSRLRQAAK